MKLLRVTFAVEGKEEGEAFQYFATSKEARWWMANESPHEAQLNYSQDVETIEVPSNKKGFVDFLNEHHTHW